MWTKLVKKYHFFPFATIFDYVCCTLSEQKTGEKHFFLFDPFHSCAICNCINDLFHLFLFFPLFYSCPFHDIVDDSLRENLFARNFFFHPPRKSVGILLWLKTVEIERLSSILPTHLVILTHLYRTRSLDSYTNILTRILF